MKVIQLLATVLILPCLACGSATETGTVDRAKPTLSVLFSFNPESYPRFIRKAYPQVAVWISQPDMKYARTAYATNKGSRDSYWGADSRPYALPVWYGIRKAETRPAVDAVTGATPSGESFIIRWNVPDELRGKTVEVQIEANVAFDYNESFPKSAKAGDANYTEVNGQPSLVWRARVDMGRAGSEITPEIAGHGQILGTDHAIHPDISKLTTARGIFHYIRVTYDPGK